MKKIFVAITTFLLALFIIPSVSNALEYKHWSTMKKGDVIYFDTTDSGWDNVYIHIWQDGGGVYKDWNYDPTMQKVEGSDTLYKFEITEDMDDTYNMVIFRNGQSGKINQTISIGYIENGYVYRLEPDSTLVDSKRIGYWYLKDNSNLVSQINNIKNVVVNYQDNKEYFTAESYSNLDELVTRLASESEEIYKLYSKQENGHDTDNYYLKVELTLSEINEIIDNLVVNPKKLQEAIDEIEDKKQELEDTYTPSTVQALLTELANAKANLTSNNITVDDVKNGVSKLKTATEGLVKKADKTQLNNLLQNIATLKSDDYTANSFADMTGVKALAQDILDNEEITQDEVDTYVALLQSKVDALKKVTASTSNSNNTSNVNNTIESPKTLDNIITIVVIFGCALLALVGLVIAKKKLASKN